MSWTELLTLLLLPVTGGLAGWVWRLRTNELHDVTRRLERLEDKLDSHLAWHLNQGDGSARD